MDNGTEAVSALLSDTEAAHGVYETTELKGVYDQDWPRWYVAYAVEHGIGDLVGHPFTTDVLARFLAESFEAFKAAEPTPAEGWAAWTARRIVAQL